MTVGLHHTFPSRSMCGSPCWSSDQNIRVTLPTRLSIGTNPIDDITRLSLELSRLSPSTKKWPGGTV